METEFRLFPRQASTIAPEVDLLYWFLIAVTVFFVGLICFLILFFAAKYRRGAQVDRSNPPTSYLLEITWAVVPFFILMICFGWGAGLYYRMFSAPEDPLQVYVVGKQWMWRLQHQEGRREINQLHVPVGQPVQLRMISEDVIHSFYIPDFRVKMDVLPGRYTTLWFEPTRVGTYHLFCAEYCGTEHSRMIGRIIVLEPREFAAWLRGETGEASEVVGRRLFEQYRCHTCHDPAPDARGPPLEGLYGSTVPLEDGRMVQADEDYIRESILNPQAKIRAGYPPIMPSFEGQIGEEEIFQIIAYIRSLSDAAENGAGTDE